MNHHKSVNFEKYNPDDMDALANFLVALELKGAAYHIDDHGDIIKVEVTGG